MRAVLKRNALALAWLLDIFLLVFEPTAASAVGAGIAGEPGLADELVRICRRESHCRVIGAHAGDAWAGPLMYRKALRAGWLTRDCPFHRGDPHRFSTRGVHGMAAAYSLRFLGDCLPPEALDIPLLSAVAAARRAKAQCREHGACSSDARHRMWAGASRFDRRRRAARRRAERLVAHERPAA